MASRDAIVVLGCRSDVDPKTGALGRRVARAAEAWHRGLAPHVVVCGGRRWAGQSEATVLELLLVEAGVPAAQIHAEHFSSTTFENVLYASELLNAVKARRLFIVTCDFHVARALKLFGSAGFDCVGLAAGTPPDGREFRRRLSELASQVLHAAGSHLGLGPSKLAGGNRSNQ